VSFLTFVSSAFVVSPVLQLSPVQSASPIPKPCDRLRKIHADAGPDCATAARPDRGEPAPSSLRVAPRCLLCGLLSHAGSQRHEADERNQSPHWHVEESIVLTQIMSRIVGNSYFGITSVLPVTQQKPGKAPIHAQRQTHVIKNIKTYSTTSPMLWPRIGAKRLPDFSRQ
jgi:hypothetical protein